VAHELARSVGERLQDGEKSGLTHVVAIELIDESIASPDPLEPKPFSNLPPPRAQRDSEPPRLLDRNPENARVKVNVMMPVDVGGRAADSLLERPELGAQLFPDLVGARGLVGSGRSCGSPRPCREAGKGSGGPRDSRR
jgi:hypothetical protein